MEIHVPNAEPLVPSSKTEEDFDTEVEQEDGKVERKYLEELKSNARFQDIIVDGILGKALSEASDVMNIPVVDEGKLQVVLLAKQENAQFIKDLIAKLKA